MKDDNLIITRMEVTLEPDEDDDPGYSARTYIIGLLFLLICTVPFAVQLLWGQP
jgi:hypothetical protein